MQKTSWMRQLLDGADLVEEALPRQPLVELLGDSRVLIENHCGVTEYGTERICVRMRFGSVAICGCGLHLGQMSRHRLVIIGSVHAIEVQRGV